MEAADENNSKQCKHRSLWHPSSHSHKLIDNCANIMKATPANLRTQRSLRHPGNYNTAEIDPAGRSS